MGFRWRHVVACCTFFFFFLLPDHKGSGELTLTVAHPLNKVLEGLSKFSRLWTIGKEQMTELERKKKRSKKSCVSSRQDTDLHDLRQTSAVGHLRREFTLRLKSELSLSRTLIRSSSSAEIKSPCIHYLASLTDPLLYTHTHFFGMYVLFFF